MRSNTPQHSVSPVGWQEERRVLSAELGESITLDALTGPGDLANHQIDDAGCKSGWLIAQRKSGHRHSVDDVLTAWYALQISPPVTEHLDLGTGIGTVGLLTLWGMGDEARLTCIEAQEISYRLLQTNIRANQLSKRVTHLFGDLRELSLGRKFSLITGSPPYFPEGTGVLPHDSQKAHARFELRGDIYDYAATAFSHLEKDGWLILCFPSAQKDRAISRIKQAGFAIVKSKDVIPRETLPSLFTLFACQILEDSSGITEIESPLTVRHRDGSLTAEMAAVRRCFGFNDAVEHREA